MPPAPSRTLRILGYLALQAALWLVLTVAFATLIQAAGWATWKDALSFSATNWLPWIAIAPAVFWLALRFPFERGRFLRSVPVHLVACVACIMVGVWVSAQFAPVRRPPTRTTPAPTDPRTPGATATARDRSVAPDRRPGEAPAGVSGRDAPDRSPIEIPFSERPAGERSASERHGGERPATEWTAGERPPTERRPGREDWSGGERTPGMRRNWSERTGRSPPPPPPTSVRGKLWRLAFLGSFWPPLNSAVLRANFSAAVYVLIACAAHAIGYYRRAQERERQALALADGLNRAKLDALRLQLQPHFLFNTLNAISALVHRNPRAADELIADLSELLRLSLKSADHEVPLSRELELLECYLAIEQTRLGDRLRIVRDFDASAAAALVPTLILQPLAENAIRHGIEPRREPGTLTITARVEGDRLRLVVADDGLGLKGPGASTARHGIGLANAEQRLKALHGTGARLDLVSLPAGGVRVQISLPIRTVPAPMPAPAAAPA